MKLISDYYRKQNEQLHQTHKDYGQKGHRHLTVIKHLRDRYKCKTVLDYGCGGGKLAKNAPFKVINYDPAIPEYSKLPIPADMVVCTDVLEHIEPELLDNVLDHIAGLTRGVAYFVIATRKDRTKLLPDGTNPHKIVKEPSFWRDQLAKRFKIVRVTPKRGEVEVICEPL